MTLYEELYFDITLTGVKSDVKKVISFLKSGGLDDFFEVESENFDYGDDYQEKSDDDVVSVVFVNDDLGIEIDEFDTEEFLEVFCRAAKAVEARGVLYDVDDDEYSFISNEGDSYYLNAKKYNVFNDELDAEARREEKDAGEDD